MAISQTYTYALSDQKKEDVSDRSLISRNMSFQPYILEFTCLIYNRTTIENKLSICVSDLHGSKGVLKMFGKKFPIIPGNLHASYFFENAHLIKIITETHIKHKNWLLSQGLETKLLPF